MRHKSSFPVRFVEFESRAFRAIEWFEFAVDEVYDVIEDRAAFFARMCDAEIDIEIGSVMPSGRIGSFERAGMRVRPV